MLHIRVLDTNMARLIGAQKIVQAAARQIGIKATIYPVADPLEICRFGLVNTMPALEINGRIMSKGRPVTMEDTLELLQGYASGSNMQRK
jgi:hypothetical protein